MDTNQINFDFIKDSVLRKNLIDSIKFLSFLWLIADIKHESSEEVYRTIILYNASIIEALLLDYCKFKKISFSSPKYSKSYTLPESYQSNPNNAYNGGVVVLAIKHNVLKNYNREVTFADMIGGLSDFLKPRLKAQIVKLKDSRNTLHLSKKRRKLALGDAEKSSKMVLDVVKKVRKSRVKN